MCTKLFVSFHKPTHVHSLQYSSASHTMQNNLDKKKRDLVKSLLDTKQLYNNVINLLEEEKTKLMKKLTNRQDDIKRTVANNRQVIGASLLGLGLSSLLVSTLLPRRELEDHPQCGVITDGKVSATSEVTFWNKRWCCSRSPFQSKPTNANLQSQTYKIKHTKQNLPKRQNTIPKSNS